ncbi:MAG: hypothetical protein AAGA75_27245 [Cyanobacteria bacterium P01_E01_bin.6]
MRDDKLRQTLQRFLDKLDDIAIRVYDHGDRQTTPKPSFFRCNVEQSAKS